MHSLPYDDCVRKGRTCGYAERFVQFFAGKKAPIVIKKKKNKEYGLLSDYCPARELHWIIIIWIITTLSKKWIHCRIWIRILSMRAPDKLMTIMWTQLLPTSKSPSKVKNPYVYSFGYHNNTAIVTRATCKILRSQHKVKISSVGEKGNPITSPIS